VGSGQRDDCNKCCEHVVVVVVVVHNIEEMSEK
jgi:hypothetical protein